VLADVEGSKKAMEEFFAAGATDLVGQFEVGGLPHEYTMSAMQTFARDVAGFAK